MSTGHELQQRHGATGTGLATRWVTLALLTVELALEAVIATALIGHRGGAWRWLVCVVVTLALLLTVRWVVVLASYLVSRWKGVALQASQRLAPAAWLKFFVIEYSNFCLQNLLLIPFRGMFRTRAERHATDGAGAVILLQHGYAHNGAVWFPTALALEARGYRVFTIDQPLFAPIDQMADHLAVRIEQIIEATGVSQLTLLAHSMGGLICRAYLRQYGSGRVNRLVTLGSPHHGTYHALLAGGRNGAQMRPGNDWLAELAKTPVSVPFTSIYSVHDTVITPQDSSRMPEALNVELAGIGHVSMPGGVAMRRHVIAALERSTG